MGPNAEHVAEAGDSHNHGHGGEHDLGDGGAPTTITTVTRTITTV